MNNSYNYANNNHLSAVSTSRLGSCHHSHEKPPSCFLYDLRKDRLRRHPGHWRRNDPSRDWLHRRANMPGLPASHRFLWNRREDPNWSDASISHSVSAPSPECRWQVWSNRKSSSSSWKRQSLSSSLGCQGSGLNANLVTLLHVGQQEPFVGEQVNKLFGFDEERDLSFPLLSLLKQLRNDPSSDWLHHRANTPSLPARQHVRWIRSIHKSHFCCCTTLYSSSLQMNYKNNFVSYTHFTESFWLVCEKSPYMVTSSNEPLPG